MSHDSSITWTPSGDCPETAQAPSCIDLCARGCEAAPVCGGSQAMCEEGCLVAYRCPGETLGHDDAICEAETFPSAGTAERCAWVGQYVELPPEEERFCAWLGLGASFETTDVLWCCGGLPEDAGPVDPATDPNCGCRWTLDFTGATVDGILEDYGFAGQPFSCEGSTVFIPYLGVSLTWDPASRVLSGGTLAYVPVSD